MSKDKELSAEDILNEFVKINLKKLSAKERKYYTVYLSTTLKAMKKYAQQLLSKKLKEQSSLSKDDELCIRSYIRSRQLSKDFDEWTEDWNKH